MPLIFLNRFLKIVDHDQEPRYLAGQAKKRSPA
jgi:hypothetical protein